MKFRTDYQAFISFMGKYHTNDWIYPAALHRALKIDIKSIYMMLEACHREGLIERIFEVYCPHCQKYSGNYFMYLTDIPGDVICMNCDEEINSPLEHTVVIYRMKPNE